ncbi:hypothetical protein EJ03DRAFT_114154 [Teratosphaeria nubilosa]|uniref:Uncharacterized protein n=1 Tax=Teratosphaeria nubilosa TaxID=161662 RepID=A0A6G1L916_9PEZI|nr:hypothetical protein EJ03DRAFT_114154 [Teratosphaeria nubilosa]
MWHMAAFRAGRGRGYLQRRPLGWPCSSAFGKAARSYDLEEPMGTTVCFVYSSQFVLEISLRKHGSSELNLCLPMGRRALALFCSVYREEYQVVICTSGCRA